MTGLQTSFRELAFAFHKQYVDTAYTEQGNLDQAHPGETMVNLRTLVATSRVQSISGFSMGSVRSRDSLKKAAWFLKFAT